MCVCVSESHERHPPMGASGSDVKQNCPSTTRLSPRKAFAIGTISLFAEFYELMSYLTPGSHFTTQPVSSPVKRA